MKPRFPDHAELIFLGASSILTFWIVGTAAGLHPDGAVLGFSATLYLIWRDMAKSEAERRERRRQHLEQARKRRKANKPPRS
jgi:hypothetical protein